MGFFSNYLDLFKFLSIVFCSFYSLSFPRLLSNLFLSVLLCDALMRELFLSFQFQIIHCYCELQFILHIDLELCNLATVLFYLVVCIFKDFLYIHLCYQLTEVVLLFLLHCGAFYFYVLPYCSV